MKLSKYILSIIFTNCFLSFACITAAQKVTVLKEFQLLGKQVVTLTASGNIEVFNLSNHSKETIGLKKDKATSFYADTLGNKLFISFEDRTLKTFDLGMLTSKKPKEIAAVQLQEHISGFLKTSANVIWGICPGGMFDVSHNRYIKTDTNFNTTHGLRLVANNAEPGCWEIDAADNIWLGYGFGEWGGGLKIFDTKKQEFKILDTCLRKASYTPLKSFFNYQGNIITTNSLHHIGPPRSCMYLIGNSCAVNIFDSDSREWMKGCDTCYDVYSLYLGPATCNSSTGKIFFYCEKGIFKINSLKEINDAAKWQLLFKPKLLWDYGQPDAVGYSMNVTKMIAFEKNKLLFLAPANGIGYYDGKKYYLLK